MDLGPEGYCPVCSFILPLTPAGVLVVHDRGGSLCGGSSNRPGRRAPKESRRFAFREEPRTMTCPRCRGTAAYDNEASGRRLRRHYHGSGADGPQVILCNASGTLVV